VAPFPGRLKPREVVIERASHPNRSQSRWLISAYERIVPSSPQRGPSLPLRSLPIVEKTGNINDMKGIS